MADECAFVIRVIVDALVSTTLSYPVTAYFSIFLNENMCAIVLKDKKKQKKTDCAYVRAIESNYKQENKNTRQIDMNFGVIR